MTKKNILIVDDELTQCKIISRFIENLGHNYLVINSGLQVVDFFMNKKLINDISYKDIEVI